MRKNRLFWLILVFVLVLTVPGLSVTVGLLAAPLRIENIVRLKGQEPTTVRGYGIVSGLNGTGDDPKAYDQTALTILHMFEVSGMPNGSFKGIGTSKNNALVEVTATIPAIGGRDGDLLDCTVVSLGNAKSLANGVLSASMLMSPLPQSPETAEPLGMAWGKITTENSAAPNVGKIKRGCRLTGDFINPYVEDGNLTFVLKQEYSSPRMAYYVAHAINTFGEANSGAVTAQTDNNGNPLTRRATDTDIAKAINAHFVVVKLPHQYFANPLLFVSELMKEVVEVTDPLTPRVVINERVGIISIDEGVEVTPTVVAHRLITAEIRPPVPAGGQEVNPQQFVDIDTDVKFRQMNGEPIVNQKLKALQASLDAVRITPQDMIEIIKILEQQGAIVGDVIYVE